MIDWGQLNKKRREKWSIFVHLKYHWQECALLWTLSSRLLHKKQFPNASSTLHLHDPTQIIPCQNVLSFPICWPNSMHCLTAMALGITPNYFRFDNLPLSECHMLYYLHLHKICDLVASLIFPVFGSHIAGEFFTSCISNSTKSTALHTTDS